MQCRTVAVWSGPGDLEHLPLSFTAAVKLMLTRSVDTQVFPNTQLGLDDRDSSHFESEKYMLKLFIITVNYKLNYTMDIFYTVILLVLY